MSFVTDAGALLLSLALGFSAATVGARFRPGAWYAELRKSRLTPPPLAFPVVWSVLYVLMAVAAWLVWREPGLAGAALVLYLAQLACNALWSWLFFGLKRPALALADIGVLWVLLVATTIAFAIHSTVAAILLLPYLAWVSLAAYLNAVIVRCNG